MRGKHRSRLLLRGATGNIPAYAGKTDIADGGRHDTAEHPRVCGENLVAIGFPRVGIGTSPRMRGKLTSV